MPSVRRVSAALAATAPVAVLLTGCVSTQTVATRARLVDERILASQKVTEVTRANPAVTVRAPVVIRDHTATAIVVTVRNDSARALTDLPISVGFRAHSGRENYLNRSTDLGYFESHIASIGSRATTTWVFLTGARIPRGRVFATVGVAQLHPSLSRPLPSITVSLRATQPERDDQVILKRLDSQSLGDSAVLPTNLCGRASRRPRGGGRAHDARAYRHPRDDDLDARVARKRRLPIATTDRVTHDLQLGARR